MIQETINKDIGKEEYNISQKVYKNNETIRMALQLLVK